MKHFWYVKQRDFGSLGGLNKHSQGKRDERQRARVPPWADDVDPFQGNFCPKDASQRCVWRVRFLRENRGSANRLIRRPSRNSSTVVSTENHGGDRRAAMPTTQVLSLDDVLGGLAGRVSDPLGGDQVTKLKTQILQPENQVDVRDK